MAQIQDGQWKGYRGYAVLGHLRICDLFAGLEVTEVGAAGPWKPLAISFNILQHPSILKCLDPVFL
jgi:hypothetical protein